MNHEPWIELAELQALGALDGDDLRRWQEHLRVGCPECENHLAQTQGLLNRLPEMLSPLAPPAHVKNALMQQIGPTPFPWIPAAAGVAVLAAALWMVLPIVRPAAQAPVAATVVAHDAQMQQILSGPQTKLIEFKDPATGQKLQAKLYWNPDACGGCLTVQGLSKIAQDKVYEFWAIDAAGPVAAGTFHTDAGGNAHLDIRQLALKDFKQFAVTIEPQGGVSAPTGPMKLLSL